MSNYPEITSDVNADETENTVLSNVSDNPNLLFNDGTVSGATEIYQPDAATITGTDGTANSDWTETQWHAGGYFNPQQPDDISAKDTVLGTAVATWSQGSSTSIYGDSSFSVYGPVAGNSALQGYTYEMQAQGGTLNDVLLESVHPDATAYSFDHQMTLSAYERIANVSGDINDGLVTLGNSITVAFNAKGLASDMKVSSYFLQFGLSDSRGQSYVEASLYDSTMGLYNVTNNYKLTFNDDGTTNLYHDNALETLPMVATTNFYKVTVNLNAGLDQLIKTLSRNDPTHAAKYQNLANWTLTSSYAGIESGGYDTPSDNTVSATADINGLKITASKDADATYSADSQKVQTVTALDSSGNDTGVTPSGNDSTMPGYSSSTSSASTNTTSTTTSSTDVDDSAYTISGTILTTSASYAKSVNISNVSSLIGNSGTVNSYSSQVVLGDSSSSSHVTVNLYCGTLTANEANGSNDVFMIGYNNGSSVLNINKDSTKNITNIYTMGSGTQTINNIGSGSVATFVGTNTTINATGGNNCIVANGTGGAQGSTINVWNSNNQIWMGSDNAYVHADGYNQVILGDGDGLAGIVNISGGASGTVNSGDRTDVIATGIAPETQNIVQTGASYLTLEASAWSNAGNLNVSMENGIVVTNGVSGKNESYASIKATGSGNTQIWAGGGSTDFTDTSSKNSEFYETGDGSFTVTDATTSSDDGATISVGLFSASNGKITGGSKKLDICWNDAEGSVGSYDITAGSGGMTLNSAHASAFLTIDVLEGIDAIDLQGSFIGDVVVKDAFQNSAATFALHDVLSETSQGSNVIYNMEDGHSVTFVGGLNNDSQVKIS